MSYQTAEVAGVVVHDATVQRVVNHLLVNFIDTTSNGLHQSTTSDDSVKLQGDISSCQFVEHQLLAEVLLFSNSIEGCQLFSSMRDIT